MKKTTVLTAIALSVLIFFPGSVYSITETQTPTVTETNTPSETVTITQSMTQTITPSESPDISLTVTATITETTDTTLTVTQTVTQTLSATQTQTATQDETSTITQTATEEMSATITETVTEEMSATITQTATETSTQTTTASITMTLTATVTPTSDYIADFENQSFTVNTAGGAWAQYAAAGNSISRTVSDSAIQGAYSGYFGGNIQGAGWSTISIETQINAAGTAVDLSNTSGLEINMKGTAGAGTGVLYAIAITSTLASDQSFRYVWAPASGWNTYKIPWASFVPESWGDAGAYTNDQLLSGAITIEFVIAENTGSAGNNIGSNWHIDAIRFYTDAATATKTVTPTLTITTTPPTNTPTVSPTPTNAFASACSKRMVAYYVSWTSYRASKIPYDKLTHICHAFMLNNADGSLNIPAGLIEPELITGARAHGVKVLISLGGATGSTVFGTMALNATARAAFVENIFQFCLTYGYSGVDIDWEKPSNAAQRTAYTAIVNELRAKFNSLPESSNWLITTALAGSNYGAGYVDFAAVLPNLDFVNVMTYDIHGPWSNHAGHNSPIYKGTDSDGACKDQMDYMITTRGIPASKINMGLPFYGYNFSAVESLFGSCGGSCTSTTTYTPYNSIDMTGYTRVWDSTSQVPYLKNDSGAGVIVYDDAESIRGKVDYALNSRNAGGVFMWELSQDYLGVGNQPLFTAMLNGVLSYCGLTPMPTPVQTAVPTAVVTPTPVVTPTYTAGDLAISGDVSSYPNPTNLQKDVKIKFNLDSSAKIITVSLYTKSFRLVDYYEVKGTFNPGANVVTLPRKRIQSFGLGLYIYRLEAWDADGFSAKSKPGTLLILY